MSTEKERQSSRLVHTDPRYAEVKSAYNHLYVWIRDGQEDEETNRHTLFSLDGLPPLQHDAPHCNIRQ